MTAEDQFGNTVTSYSGVVHFTSSDGQAVLPANSGLTNGVGSFSVTLKTAGAQTVTATDTVTASITGSASVMVSAASGGATHFVVSAPGSAVAGSSFSVSVTAEDQFGNTVTSYSGVVHFTSSDGQAVLPANSGLTNGVGSFSVTLKTAGAQTVTATDTVTASITGSASVMVSAASGGATHFVVSAPGSAVAGSSFSVSVTAEDQFGNTVTSYSGVVHFTSSDGQAVLPANSGLTNGVGSFSVTLKTAGAQTVTATDTVTASITGSASVMVSAASGGATHFVVSAPGSAVAGSSFSVSVTAEDQFGNTVTSYSGVVHFTSSDGQAVLPANSGLTNGVGSFSVTLKTAGAQTVTATDTVTASITGSASVMVSAASGGATHFVVSAPGSAVAGSSFSVSVTAEDQFGNTVTSYSGVVHFTSSDGQAVLPANSGLTNGVGSFSVTLKTAGAQTVTATDTVTASITGSASVMVSAASGGATHFVVSAPGSAVAGSSFSVSVTAEDQFGNTVTSYSGVVHFTSSDGQAVLPANSGLTNGVGSFSVTLKTAGAQTVTATDTVTASITGSASVMVSAASGGATHFVVSAPGSAVAGSSFSVSVTAEDQFGNTVTSYSGVVHFTSSDGQAVLPANSGLTNGVGSFSVTLKTAGAQTVTATDTVTASITGSASVMVSAASGGATHFVVSAPGSAVAGSSFSVSVTAEDQFGNTVTSYSGVVHFTSSDGQAVLPANSGLTNGVGSFSVTLKTAGAQTVTATDTVTASITGSASVMVSAASGGATHFVVSAPGSAVAGSSFSVSVTAEDQFGNTVTSYSGVVHFTSSDGQAVLPANSGLTNGVGSFSVTLKTAGAQTVTATDTVTASITGSASVMVSAASGGATHFVVSAPGSAVAGSSFSVSVTAEDQFGNTVTSYSGVVHFTSSDGQAVLPANSGLTNGVGSFSVTLKTAGAQTVTATDTVTASITGTSGVISVSADGAVSFVVSGFPSFTTAGAAHTITVTAKDAYGNVATGYSGIVKITSSDSAAVLPANSGLTNGAGSFVVTLETAGIQSITATDTVTSAITGSQTGIQVNAAGTTSFVVSGFPNPVTAGVAGSVTVTAKDAYGNTATGYTGTVHITSSDGQAILPINYAFVSGDNGIHIFSLTLKTAGIQSITATDTVTSTITGSQTGIRVNAAPSVLSFIVISPKSATIVAGGSQVYSTVGFDQYGNILAVVAVYSVSAGASVSGNLVSSSVVGSYTVTATFSGKTDTATLTVTAAASVLDHIVISPKSATIVAGGSQVYSTVGFDQYGSSLGSVVAVYSVSAGASVSGNLVSSSVVGSYTVTATFSGKTDTATLTVTANGLDHILVTPATASVSAGGSQVFVSTAYDQFNNIIGVVTSSTIWSISNGAGGTFVQSTGTYTSQYAGTWTITANYNGKIATASLLVTAAASVLDHIVISPKSATIVAGGSQVYSTVGFDQYGSSLGSVVAVYSVSAGASVSGNLVSSSVVGSYTVTATFSGKTDTATLTVIQAVVGGATHYIVSATPTSIPAGSSVSVNVTAVDANGNRVTVYASMIHFTSSDGLASLPFDSLLSSGTGIFSVILKTSGIQTVTATDAIITSITGTSNGVTVTVPAGSATHFIISAPTSAAAGSAFNLNVTAVDQFGNRVTNYAGIVNFTSTSTGTLPANSTLTGGTGIFSVILNIAGSQTITATDTVTPSITGSATLTITGYTVIFTETGLAPGTAWNITFGGTVYLSSTIGTIVITGASAITYSWSTPSYIQLGQTRYATSQTSGTINVPTQVTQNIIYQTQYLVTYAASGNVLTVTVPPNEWVNSGGAATGIFPAQVTNSQSDTRCNFINDNRTTITKPTTILATYQTQYYLTVSSAYGTTSGAGWYNSGSTATAGINGGTVSGSSGIQYLFTTWSGDASGTALTASITMNSPKTATANWKTQYYLTIITATGSPTGQGWYDAGSTATIGLSELVSGRNKHPTSLFRMERKRNRSLHRNSRTNLNYYERPSN